MSVNSPFIRRNDESLDAGPVIFDGAVGPVAGDRLPPGAGLLDLFGDIHLFLSVDLNWILHLGLGFARGLNVLLTSLIVALRINTGDLGGVSSWSAHWFASVSRVEVDTAWHVRTFHSGIRQWFARWSMIIIKNLIKLVLNAWRTILRNVVGVVDVRMMSSCLTGLNSLLLAFLGHDELSTSDGATKVLNSMVDTKRYIQANKEKCTKQIWEIFQEGYRRRERFLSSYITGYSQNKVEIQKKVNASNLTRILEICNCFHSLLLFTIWWPCSKRSFLIWSNHLFNAALTLTTKCTITNIQIFKMYKSKKEGTKWVVRWRKQVPQSLLLRAWPQNKRKTGSKGNALARVALMIIFLPASLSPACNRPLLVKESTRQNQK